MTPTPSDAQPVKRYSRYARGEIVEDRSGPWVKFSDHQSALDAERQKREAAERERDQFRDHAAKRAMERDTAESSLAKANARIAELEKANASNSAIVSIQTARINELLRWQRAVAANIEKERDDG